MDDEWTLDENTERTQRKREEMMTEEGNDAVQRSS
jgi:hypothetical protein